MKKQVIRIGDTVRVVNNRPIERVGYPLIWYDLIEEVEADPRTREAWNLLARAASKHDVRGAAMPRYFLKAVAMLRVEERGFGGDRQLIYYTEKSSPSFWPWEQFKTYYEGYVGVAHAKKVVKTGKHRPMRCGHTDSYDGREYWEELGGLDDCKTHVLLEVGSCWFAQEDVELVKRKPK